PDGVRPDGAAERLVVPGPVAGRPDGPGLPGLGGGGEARVPQAELAVTRRGYPTSVHKCASPASGFALWSAGATPGPRVSMDLVLEAAVVGVLTGGVYALMASGLTLIFGVMRIINVGQGALVVLGAYLSFALFRTWHIDPFLGLVVTMPVMF